MDLVKMITDKAEAIANSGQLDEMIENTIKETFERIIDRAFSYGDADKEFKKVLEEKLKVSLSNVNLDQLSKITTDIVQKQVDAEFTDELTKKITKSIDGTIGVLEKKEWKLSEIIQKYIDNLGKDYDDMDGDECRKISLFVEDSGYGDTYIYFDHETRDRRYECDNRISIDKHGVIYVAKIGGDMAKPTMAIPMDTFDKFIFSLYCNSAKIEVDEHDCKTEYFGEWCD